MLSTNKDSSHLQDGFHEVFTFRGHKLSITGVNPVDISDDFLFGDSARKQTFISWDAKHIILWEKKLSNDTSPKIIKKLEFLNKAPNYICAIIYIPKMKVFLVAALDMTFQIYDKQLSLMETIHHDERAILNMEYLPERGLIAISGASGLSLWRMYKGQSIDSSLIMEKTTTLRECQGWINRVIVEQKSKRLYAIQDSSVTVFNYMNHKVLARLEKIHDAPITRTCWYDRSQFYITGCSAGEIKCWTSHFDASLFRHDKKKNSKTDFVIESEDTETKFALLHNFHCHTRAITGLVLHAVPGLLISSSLDGFIKVLNLENFTELYNAYTGTAVCDLKLFPYYSGAYACLFHQYDGAIVQWKLTSCCNFFGISSSRIGAITLYDSLQSGGGQQTQSQMQGVIKEAIDDFDNDEDDDSIASGIAVSSSLIHTIEQRQQPRNVIAAHGGHDLRLYSEKGAVLCRMEPEVVIEGITAYTISVHQQMIFCLMESGNIRVFCMKTFICEVLAEIPRQDGADAGSGTCICLINVLPTATMHGVGDSNSNAQHRVIKDLRGETVSSTVRGTVSSTVSGTVSSTVSSNVPVEVLVIGSQNGTVIMLDTYNGCELVYIMQANNGSLIDVIKYRRARKELLIKGYDEFKTYVNIKVWALPEMVCTHHIDDLQNVSAFDISANLGLFGVGTEDGYVHLYEISMVDDECHEIMTQGALTHSALVADINFLDELRIYVTCAIDSSVIIWDYTKQFLRSIKFHMPTHSVVFYGHHGDILISQGNYILNIARSIWDEGDVLEYAKTHIDPWTIIVDPVQEIIESFGPEIKKINNNKAQEIEIAAAASDDIADRPELPTVPMPITVGIETSLSDRLNQKNKNTFFITENRSNNNDDPAAIDSSQSFEKNLANNSVNFPEYSSPRPPEHAGHLRPRLVAHNKPDLLVGIDDILISGYLAAAYDSTVGNNTAAVTSIKTANKFGSVALSPRARLTLLNSSECKDAIVQDRVNAELLRVLAPSTMVDSYKSRKNIYEKAHAYKELVLGKPTSTLPMDLKILSTPYFPSLTLNNSLEISFQDDIPQNDNDNNILNAPSKDNGKKKVDRIRESVIISNQGYENSFLNNNIDNRFQKSRRTVSFNAAAESAITAISNSGSTTTAVLTPGLGLAGISEGLASAAVSVSPAPAPAEGVVKLDRKARHINKKLAANASKSTSSANTNGAGAAPNRLDIIKSLADGIIQPRRKI